MVMPNFTNGEVLYAGDLNTIADAVDAIDVKEQYRGANVPAFYAIASSNQTKTGTATLTKFPFATERLDNGGHYDAVNSRFIAPVAGIYSFSVSFAATTVTGGPEMTVFKNGSVLYGNIAVGYSNSFMTFGSQFLLSLVPSDYIEIYWNNNNNTTVTIDGGRSSFSGYLVN